MTASDNEVDRSILRARRLTKTYADGNVSALVDVDLAIEAGQFVAIMGPSGSGKSTLLNLLGTLDSPTRGEVWFQGQPLSQARSLDRLRAQKIGFVFQSFHLLPTLTVLENVQIPMFAGPRTVRQRVSIALKLLEAVGMSHRGSHLPNQLSVGERQRVAIARALANDPVLLLADEPTGNLDSRTGMEILGLFESLQLERQVTLVIVTHTSEVAERADRIVRIRDGRIETDEVQPRDRSARGA